MASGNGVPRELSPGMWNVLLVGGRHIGQGKMIGDFAVEGCGELQWADSVKEDQLVSNVC